MVAPNRHRIGRQVLEIAVPELVSATQLQEEVARPFRGGPPAVIERLFDRLAGPDELVLIDRLEIDLGALTGADWKDQFLTRLAGELEEALHEARPPSVARTPSPELSIAVGGPQGVVAKQYLYFLEHGHLPWWGGRPGGPWASVLPEPPSERLLHDLRTLLRRRPAARLRLAVTAGDDFLDAAVAAWTGLPDVARVVELLLSARSETPEARSRQALWSILLEHAVDEAPAAPADRVELVRRLIAAIIPAAIPEPETPAARASVRDGETRDRALALLAELPGPWREWRRLAVEQAAQLATRERGQPVERTVETARPDAGPDRNETAARGGDEPGRKKTEPSAPKVAERAELAGERAKIRDGARGLELDSAPSASKPPESVEAPRPVSDATATGADLLAVEGAGVVILHPFLAELFRERGLLEQNDFRDERARCRAVQLLTRLTFGQLEVEEYDQVLCKLLCAMPWEEPVDPIELSVADVEACDELLDAILGHWKALGTSSVGWLRQHFLLRSGSLEPVDHGWKLSVDARAQDLLLGRLPWGIGFVRLPWMREQLYVRWNE